MRSSSSDLISLTLTPPLAEIAFKENRGLNILDRDLLCSLKSFVEHLRKEEAIKVTIIHSKSEKGFVAGADMRELKELDEKKAVIFSRLGQNIFSTMEELPILFLGVIDGYCIGGGFDLALACDLLLLSERAFFQHPGTSLGFITGFGGNFRLAVTCGRQKSLQTLITGRKVDGKKMADHVFSLFSFSTESSFRDEDMHHSQKSSPLHQARLIAKRFFSLHSYQIGIIKKVLQLPSSMPLKKRVILENSLSHLFFLGTPSLHNKDR